MKLNANKYTFILLDGFHYYQDIGLILLFCLPTVVVIFKPVLVCVHNMRVFRRNRCVFWKNNSNVAVKKQVTSH